MENKVIVIGAGASGMVAAIAAVRAGAIAVILEHKDKPGKKLLATGNGKCNLTNLACRPEYFRSEHPGFAWQVVEEVPPEAAVAFFEDLGLLLTCRNGYVYPLSGQAVSVLDALRFELDRLGIPIIYGCKVERISEVLEVAASEPEGGLSLQADTKAVLRPFLSASVKGRWKADSIILAAGSRAAANTGSDGSGYELARRLGHRIIKPLPALVQLRCGETWHKAVSGVRTEAAVTLYGEEDKLASDRGELQFTDYGVSGIPVFQISRYAACALDSGKRVSVGIDLLPAMNRKELLEFLRKRRDRVGGRSTEEFLNGVLNKKLCRLILTEAKLPLDTGSGKLTDGQLHKIMEKIKDLRAAVIATNSFEQAQVCRGGVDTKEVSPQTMESNLVKGLYFAGEILDVDGICGGYNLQWAWSSGILAGKNAGSNTEWNVDSSISRCNKYKNRSITQYAEQDAGQGADQKISRGRNPQKTRSKNHDRSPIIGQTINRVSNRDKGRRK